MSMNRDDEFNTTRSDEFETTPTYAVPERSSGRGTMWTLILGAAAAAGLIYAFSTWDSGPIGTQTSMREQTQQTAPMTTETAPPAVQPAPAPDGGNTAGGGTTQPANP